LGQSLLRQNGLAHLRISVAPHFSLAAEIG
jgi:hypothetical protein